ncbi:receptor-like protein EIX1 [Senna tora]|uniref:Receptor-like protein EIX1 n=1 Tax=Senna tora TaxID=362788 RepID=A0A834TDV8_9FABA|nr:receptor-like protein EIX1 [Senna tora]
MLHLGLQGALTYDENVEWVLPLSSLQYLELNYVNLSTAFDWLHVLHSLPSLTELHLSGCHFHHHFQPSTINFSSLAILDISYSYNFGASSMIPKWMLELKKLVYLRLKYNQLQGSIPDGIQNLTLLQHLDLSYNSFNSSIPNWLYSFTSLNFLDLNFNNLHGTISSAIGNLTSLVTLDLSVTLKLEHNHFTGNLPTSMGSLAFLDMLHLRNNRFSVKFPAILRSNRQLISLDLGENQFSGVIPSWVGQSLFNLMILRLASNKFSGSIPHQICDMSLLHILDLSQNNLIGNIPKCVNRLNAMLVINTSSNSYILRRGNQSSSIVDVLLLLKGRVDDYSSILGLVTRFWGVIGPLLYNRSWRHAYFGFIDDLWFKIRLLSDEAFQK